MNDANTRVAGTLHVAKVTPRVLKNKWISWNRFEAALKRVHQHDPYVIKAVPRIFWIGQLNLINRGYRGSKLHDSAVKALEQIKHFPMGH